MLMDDPRSGGGVGFYSAGAFYLPVKFFSLVGAGTTGRVHFPTRMNLSG